MRQSVLNIRPPQPGLRSGFVKITLIGVAGLLGIFLMIAVTPTLQYHQVTVALQQAERLLDQENPGEAIQHLYAVEPLLEFFPELTPAFRGHLIRAYTQAGHLDEAFAVSQKPAGWTEAWRSKSNPTQPTVSFLVRFAHRFPAFKATPFVNPYTGKSDLTVFRDQLVSMDRWDLFLPYDPSTPPPAAAAPIRAAQSAPLQKPEPPPDPTPLVAPKPLPPPPPSPEETRARQKAQLAQLTGQVETLSNQIVSAKADLAKAVNPPLTPAQTAAKARHQKAVQTFNQFVDENIKLKKDMDSATGPRRVELLDKLKTRRFQEQNLQRELREAKAADEKLLPPTNPKIDLEKRITSLSAEYEHKSRQIEALRKDLIPGAEPENNNEL
jgi:hypothetical protein